MKEVTKTGFTDAFKRKGPNVKIQENVDPGVCKSLDGTPLTLKDGTQACLWVKDDGGKPIEVDVENITPGKFKIRNRETGEIIKEEGT